jgi:heptosyltransferase-2
MIGSIDNILVIQTAFIGDAILTLPLIQKLKQHYPKSSIDVVVVPKTAEIFSNHPAITGIIPYDKHGTDKGIAKFWKLRKKLKSKTYDLIIVPHRSIRSAALAKLLKPKISIGFNRSAGRRFFTDIAQYNPSAHEIERNLSLLNPLGTSDNQFELPVLYPTQQDVKAVDIVLADFLLDKGKMVAVAPGTIWNTKRWPKEKFTAVCKQISSEGVNVLLVGSREDEELCREICEKTQTNKVVNAAGKLSLLQSAELIRRCIVLISNDSAPMHLAVAVGTPVVAIFGATVPEFGFAPRGPHDIVIETKGLKCRPCSIHGGKKCPIKTFECMIAIAPEIVVSKTLSLISCKE